MRVLLILVLFQSALLSEPFKKCRTVVVIDHQKSFKEVKALLYKEGFSIESEDEEFGVIEVKAVEHRNTYVTMRLMLEKESISITGKGGLNVNDREHAEYIGMSGGMYKRMFEKMQITAKLFGKQLRYK